jgi:hypothetical protein
LTLIPPRAKFCHLFPAVLLKIRIITGIRRSAAVYLIPVFKILRQRVLIIIIINTLPRCRFFFVLYRLETGFIAHLKSLDDIESLKLRGQNFAIPHLNDIAYLGKLSLEICRVILGKSRDIVPF